MLRLPVEALPCLAGVDSAVHAEVLAKEGAEGFHGLRRGQTLRLHTCIRSHSITSQDDLSDSIRFLVHTRLLQLVSSSGHTNQHAARSPSPHQLTFLLGHSLGNVTSARLAAGNAVDLASLPMLHSRG